MQDLTQEYLKKILKYDTDTGILTNRVTRNSRAVKGNRAGSEDSKGYRTLNINKKKYMEHRLIWFYVHGQWPATQIDHINNIKNDNRLKNLREATVSENQFNVQHKGCWLDRGKWIAKIRVEGKRIHLGRFNTEIEAETAYKEACILYHREFANTGP